MDAQEPISFWPEQSPNPTDYHCMDCGRRDETVRFVSYPYVFSLLVVTFRRAFAGMWCKRHRLLRGSLACFITSVFGWFGIPWGFLFTPAALYQLARGGYKDEEVNARILYTLGQEKLTKGDRQGAIRCFEQSLRFKDQPDIRERLKSLYTYNSINTTIERGMIWQFALALIIPSALFFAGILIGLMDYGISSVFGSIIGEEGHIVVVILSWVPLVLFLFTGVVSLRKLLEWNSHVTRRNSTVLAILFTALCTAIFLYAVASGEAVGTFIQYILYGIAFNSLTDFILTLPPLVTRGGIYFFYLALASGELWGIIYVIILLAFAVLSLIVIVPQMMKDVNWQKTLREISDGSQINSNAVPLGAWSAVVTLLAGVLLLFLLFPQRSNLDFMEASDHYFAGLSYMDTQEFKLAIEEFEQAIQLRPNDLYARIGLGYAYYYQEDFTAASEIFLNGLERFPDSADLLEAAGWAFFQLGDMIRAEKYFEDALKIPNASAGSHLGLGWIYLGENPEASVERFNVVLSQFPDDANAHLGLGTAYYALRDYDRAIEELQIASKDEFNKPLAYFTLGNLYVEQRRYDLAIDAYMQAATSVPDYYDPHVGLAQVYINVGEFEEALQSLERAVALQPENSLSYIFLSGVYSWQGQHDQSLVEIEKALEVDSESKMAHAIKAALLYKLGKEEESEVELKRVDEIESIDYQSEYIVATVLRGMHRYAEAISHLETAIELLPRSSVDYYTSLADIYSALGQYEQAQQAIDDAIAIDPKNPTVYVAQGLSYIDQEKLDAAEKSFRIALDLDPDEADAHAGLSFIQLQFGNIEGSVREAELATKSKKHTSWGFERLAFAYYSESRLDDATVAAREAIRLNPTDSLSHYILGVCLMEQGMAEDAIQEFEAFLHYYYDRAYVRDFKIKAEEYLSTLNSLP